MGETEHVSISKGTIHSDAHVEGRWERVLGFVTCFRFFFIFKQIYCSLLRIVEWRESKKLVIFC